MKLTKIRKFANETPEITIIDDEGTYIRFESPKKTYSCFYKQDSKVEYYDEYKSNGFFSGFRVDTQNTFIMFVKLSLKHGF